MRKILIIFFIGFSIVFCEEAKKEEVQKSQIDIEPLIEKVDEIEKRIDEIEKKVTEIEKKLKNIDENFNEIRKTIRNFQIYIQPQATIKPTEEEWKSIERGMTKDDVMKILGSPEEIKKQKNQTEIWYYFGSGRIYFNQSGEVIKREDDIYTPPTRIR
jgi:septal ring factor EnvC (AmiA/AmiB activator)